VVSLYPDSYKLVVAALVRARKKAGVTQLQLAATIGQRQTFISKYELGERRLDIAEFLEICRAIGADPQKLLRAAEKSPASPRKRAPTSR
jgi:transcriptional regulator with XRE-family HTH domain